MHQKNKIKLREKYIKLNKKLSLTWLCRLECTFFFRVAISWEKVNSNRNDEKKRGKKKDFTKNVQAAVMMMMWKYVSKYHKCSHNAWWKRDLLHITEIASIVIMKVGDLFFLSYAPDLWV